MPVTRPSGLSIDSLGRRPAQDQGRQGTFPVALDQGSRRIGPELLEGGSGCPKKSYGWRGST